jgi:cytochrome c551/c552
MRLSLGHAVATAIVVSVFAACSNTPEPTTPPPAASSAPVATVAPPATTSAPVATVAPPASTPPPVASAPAPLPTVWSDSMPHDQQMDFMKQNVQPRLSKVFQDHDATKFANFGCVTCHGPSYKNPHEFLPHLTLKGDKIAEFKDKPKISKWMAEKVSPEMATAMGMKPYDPKTHEGFGCGGCHTIDKK